MKKNISLSQDILSLWWWFIDETYNPGIIANLIDITISKRGYEILQYNDSLWLTELRETWRKFLQDKFNVQKIHADEIMITNWATAGIDLAARFILQWKYDSVALSPVYDTALESLKRNSKNIFTIPLNLFGEKNWDILDWKKLKKIMQGENTKLIYVNPNFQNPSWIILDENTKDKLYKLSTEYWVTVIEDDPYKLYNYDNLDLWKNIIDMDKNRSNVIYLNSLSKVFYPGLRIGFLVWNINTIKWISELQKYSTSSPNLIMQWAAIEALDRWEIDKSIDHYIKKIDIKLNILITALEKEWLLWSDSPIEFSNSKWGFYLWWKFKNWINTDELSKQALQYWVSFVPWSIYWKDLAEYNDSFRIAYAQIDESSIVEAVWRFSNLLKDTI